MKVFTMDDLRQLGVCAAGINRAEAFGGSIENSVDGWAFYVTAYPHCWYAPVFTAQAMQNAGMVQPTDLAWQIARIACRESHAPDLMAHSETLNMESLALLTTGKYSDHYAVIAGVCAAGARHSAMEAASAAIYANHVTSIVNRDILACIRACRRVKREITNLALAVMGAE